MPLNWPTDTVGDFVSNVEATLNVCRNSVQLVWMGRRFGVGERSAPWKSEEISTSVTAMQDVNPGCRGGHPTMWCVPKKDVLHARILELVLIFHHLPAHVLFEITRHLPSIFLLPQNDVVAQIVDVNKSVTLRLRRRG